MSPLPWITGHIGFNHLRVPIYSQPPNEPDCVIYSLWMVSHYFANSYPDPAVRESMNAPTVQDINYFIATDELGWKPNQSDLTELSEWVTGVKFSHESWSGSPPKPLIGLAEENLSQGLPLIAFIDSQLLRQGHRGSGPLHSIVILGYDSSTSEVAIADPWFAAVDTVSEHNLEDAWDPMLNHIIDVEPRRSSESTSGADQ